MLRYLVAGTLICTVVALAGAAQVTEQPLDKQFVTQTAICTHTGIKSSEWAAKQAANAKVKEFAQRMAKGYTDVNEQLAKIGPNERTAVAAGPHKQTQDALDRLQNLKGADVDREYMKLMVDEHRKAIALFESQTNAGKEQNLKEFAARLLPGMRTHLKEAEQLSVEITSK